MPTLDDAFTSFKHDAIRLETLPMYGMPEEAQALDDARQGKQPDLSFLDEWHEYLVEATSGGRSHRRLRLVSVPPTEYESFEIRWAFPSNAKAGEEIRLMRRSDSPDHRDVWIFDHGVAFELIYDERGAYLGDRIMEPDKVARAVEWLDVAWASATDLADFSLEQ